MSMEIADLNFRLNKAELDAKESSECLAKYHKEETDHEDQLQQLQTERNAALCEQQKAKAALAVSYQLFTLMHESFICKDTLFVCQN